MARGRNRSASDARVLLEILLRDNSTLRYEEIAEELPIEGERTRQILDSLEERGYVDIQQHGANFYQLTDEGFEYLKSELRDRVD